MPDDILNKVVSFISGDSGATISDKKILLKQIHKDISQNKFVKYYKVRTEEVEPVLAQVFYDIYKLIYPAQLFLQNVKIERVKQLCLESFMSRSALAINKKVSLEAMQERVKAAPPKDIIKELKEDLDAVEMMFDNDQIRTIDQCYNLITAYIQFVNFNYFGLLQRFDAKMVEGNFSFEPQFETIRAEDLVEQFGNFLAVAHPVDPAGDWKTPLAIFKLLKNGADPISPEQWARLLANLKELKQSNILVQISQLTLKDPIWTYKPRIPDEKLVETWLGTKKSEINGVINKIVSSQRSIQVSTLANAIFGVPEITRLHYYNVKSSEIYKAKGFEGFIYAEALNFLTAFMNDFLTKDIKELCETLLIRGKWKTVNDSLIMSESLHSLVELVPRLTDLDDTLSEDGEKGPRLKAAIVRVDRDKSQFRYINGIFAAINEDALELINAASQNFIVIGKHMKSLLDDSQKKLPDLIINWKEIGSFSKNPLLPRMTDTYKKINYLIQLMLIFTHAPE
ncbi:DUF5312 family protein [Breznakiellaceae bacterium SP9]